MSDAAPASTSSHPTEDDASNWGPVVAWLLWTFACTGTLAIFAFRMKISAQFPTPQEDQGFLAVQIVALLLASWLSPLLLAEWHRLVLATATVVPLLVIAHILRSLPIASAVPGIAITAAWLAALHWLVRWPWVSRFIAIVSVLGPVLWYLSQEFAPTPFHVSHSLAAISPPLGAAATSLPGRGAWVAFWPILVVCIARMGGQMAKLRRARVI